MTSPAPFQLQVLVLRHPESGSLWVRRWSATAAHGLRSRVQLQILWQPVHGSAFEGRWELDPADSAANWDLALPAIQAKLTSGQKHVQWSWQESAIADGAAPSHSIISGNGTRSRAVLAAARLALGRSFSYQSRAVRLESGALSVSDTAASADAAAAPGSQAQWAGAQGVVWSLSAERMPRSIFLWSHASGAFGLQLALLPRLSISTAVSGASHFARMTFQSAPTRFPFATHWIETDQELELRVLGEGKSTHAFELESPSGVPADTRVSLGPAIEIQTTTQLSRAGLNSGAFPDLFDLSLPLPGAHL